MRSVAEIFRSYAEFDAQGRHCNGMDKQSNHNYGEAYEALFPDRPSVRLMLEVGVADGSSLLAWRDVFPNAVCVGMDVHPSVRASGARLEFHLGDQRSLEDCRLVTSARQFDFIVEDAMHELSATLMTLLYLWPYVKPGGLYVVEEFANIGGMRSNIEALWPFVEIVDTVGPFGGTEPLVMFRKPVYGKSPLQDAYKEWSKHQ